MKSESEFFLSILKNCDCETIFSLDNRFCYTFFNEAFLTATRTALGHSIKIGESILSIVQKQDQKIFLERIKKAREGVVSTDRIEISENLSTFSVNWVPVYYKNEVVGTTIICSLTPPNSVKANYKARLNLFENLDKINKAIHNSRSPESLIKNVFKEVFKIFDIDKSFFVYPCIPNAPTYKVCLIALTPGNKAILKNVKEINTSPYIADQLKILSKASKPLMYGYGTERPLPQVFTEKFGLKTYVAITLRPQNDDPWLLGFSQKIPGTKWSDEMLCLLQEIGQRLSDGLGTILILRDLQRREKENRAIVNAVPDLLFRVSKDGTIIDFKKPAFVNFDRNSSDLIGKKISDILPKLAKIKAYLALRNTFKNHTVELFEFDLDFGNKHYFVEVRVIELLKNEALFVVRNISDRVEALLQLKKSEFEFHSLVENLPSFVGRFDLSGRFTYVNDVALNTYKLTTGHFIGKTYKDVSSEKNLQSNDELYEELLKVITSNKPTTKEVIRFVEDRIHYFEVKFIPERSENGVLQSVLGISDDITEKKLTQVELERTNRALRMLSKVNQVLTRIHDEQELIERVCEIIVDLGGYRFAWVGYVEHDEDKTVRPSAFFGDNQDYILNAKVSWDENNPHGKGPAGTVIRTGKTYIVNDIVNDPHFSPWREAAINNGFNSIIALPLSHDDLIIGVLGIYSIDTGLFEAKEVELLEEMTNNLSFGINALRVEAVKKVAEQKLARSEERYRLLLDGLTDYHYSVDLKNFEPVVEVRQRDAFTAITGYPADSFTNNRDFWYTLIVSEDSERAFDYRRAVFNGEKVDPIDYRIICKDGSIKWVHDKKILINDSNGTPISIEGVVKDITLQKNAEEALMLSEERFSKVFRKNPFSLSIYDATEFRIVDINRGYTKLTGYSYEEVIGRTADELNLYFDLNEKDKIRKILHEKGLLENFEFRFRTKSGGIMIGLNTTIEINIANKKHFLSIVQNITSKKKAETDLRKLSMAIEQSPVSVVITDLKGNIEYVNPKFTAVTGYVFEEIRGENPRFLNSGKLPHDYYCQLWKTITAGKEWFGEFHNKKKNGELFWEFASISPVFDSNGEITNYIAVKEDITDKKDTERKILNTIIDTEEKERSKFAQELHDGLGPILSTVKLYFQWLAETPEGPKRERIINTGLQNIDEALQTIKEISNRLSPRILRNFGLNAALETLINRINETQKLTIDFTTNIPQRLESQIEMAAFRIISELMNNTIKHAGANEVTISLCHEMDNKSINLFYSDNGKGFDLNSTMTKEGYGIRNIIQRIKSLNGSVNFKRETEQMIIDINIPII